MNLSKHEYHRKSTADSGQGPIFRKAKTGIQARLSINKPGDIYEQEADAMAERVMHMASVEDQLGSVTGLVGASVQRKCFKCEEEEEKRRLLMRKMENSSSGPQVSQSLVSSLNANKGGGSTLPQGTRRFMENAFSTDFSSVRVHTGSLASEMSKGINAKAFTYGSDIFFREGQYNPQTREGKHLLAHELTHSIQQRNGQSIQRQLFPPIPIIINPTATLSVASAIEVTATDARQETTMPWYYPPRYTGPLTHFFRGDVTMTDVSSMVRNVLRFLNGRRISRLNIMDHGNSAGVEIGSDWLTSPADVARHSANLSRLRTSFASNAIVHMNNCEAGQNQSLICALAAAFSVPVYAGTGLQNPLLGFNLGDYVSCTPSGVFNPNAGRPPTPSVTMISGNQTA